MKNQLMRQFVAVFMINLFVSQQIAQAAVITLATSPLANSTTEVVRPNLMYVLDDSGSMAQDYTPDYLDDSGSNAMCWKDNTASAPYLYDTALSNLSKGCATSGFKMLNQSNDIPYVTSSVNYQYYNPTVKYTPPLKADGTSYDNASTSSPKSDGFLSASGTSNLFTTGWKHPVWCNSSGASPTAASFVGGTGTPGSSSDSTNWRCKENADTTGSILYPDNTYVYAKYYNNNAFYYSLSPWEYCTDSTLTSCIVSSAPSGIYTEPSTMRWCAAFDGDKKFTGCQGRWDSSHKIPKYLGYVANKSYGSLTVTDATAGRTITQITINGNNLLTSTVSATGAVNTTAQAICNAIKAGPSAATYDVRSGSTTWGTCNSVASGLVEIRRKTADTTDNGQAITVSGPGFSSGAQATGTITIPAGNLANDVLVEAITVGGTSITPSISAGSPQAFSAGTSADSIATTMAGLVGNGYSATAAANVITVTKNTVGVDTSALALVAPGVKATATITVGTTGQTAGVPADLGGISASGGPTQIVGHLTSAQLTNGTNASANATTIRNNVGNGFTATNPTSTTVKVTAPTAGAAYNGQTLIFTAGTPAAASAATNATGTITFSGSFSSDNKRLRKLQCGGVDVITQDAVSTGTGGAGGANQRKKNLANSIIANDKNSYVFSCGGACALGVTSMTVTGPAPGTTCTASSGGTGSGNNPRYDSSANFTVNFSMTAGSAGSLGATDFAPALSGTAFSGGVDALAATGSNLSGGASLTGTVVVSTTPMTNGSPTPVRSEVGIFKRTDIIATAANDNTYKDGNLVANGTTMTYPKTANRTDCVTTAGICTYDEELQNFANWYSYYRYRDIMMKSATTLAFSGLDGTDYNVGYDNISNCDTSDSTCATSVKLGVGQFVDSCTGTCSCSSSSPYACSCGGGTGSCQRSTWWSQMIHSNPSSATPLRAITAKIGQYYGAKLGAQTAATPTQNDPVEYSCQQNYMLLVTDGYWNEAERSSIKRLDGTDIGNIDNVSSGTGKVDPPYYDGQMASTTCPAVSSSTKRGSASSCRTLADVTYYYYSTDLRDSGFGNSTNKQVTTRDVSENNVFITTSDPNKQQHMTFFGMGLGVDGVLEYRSDYLEANTGDYADIVAGTRNWPAVMNLDPTAVDDLWHAAVNGHGKYFNARDPEGVKTGLTDALNSIQLRVGAAAAAATSNLMPTKTDNGAYVASYGTVEWWGDLQARNIDVDNGGAVSEPANASPNECVNDSGCPWSAQKKLDVLDWSSQRKTYIAPTPIAPATVPDTGAALRSFTYAGLSATEKTYFDPTTGITQYNAIHTAYPTYTTADLASKLVDFLRGDTSSEQDGAGGDQLWRNRTHVLGDIVNTQPVYVRGAGFSYDESTNPGYDQFILDQANRQSVVYVSANDGYLHAFAAQDSSDGTIAGGTELFAFMPSLTMQTVKELADVDYVHQYFVDGLITVGDVYFDSAWHTILVGGLGGGGKSYYALDVTDPSNPKYLWEITNATSGFTNLGYTYGNVSINKLPCTPIAPATECSGDWAVMFTSGYNNTDGAGYLYAVNPKTGALVSGYPLTTGSGTAASPSNLGKINAWVENLLIDNTATDVYAGDMEGDLWRFNLVDKTVSKLAHLEDAVSPTPNPQPITTKPEMTKVDGVRVIYVGTGRYISIDDQTDTKVQSFYAIKDDGVPTGGWNPRSDTGASGNLFLERKLIAQYDDGTVIKKFDGNCNVVDARVVCSAENSPTVIPKTETHTCGTNTITKWPDKCSNGDTATVMNWTDFSGWFVDFPDSGERLNVDMNLSLKTLTFGTNVPVSNACTTGGYGWLNYLDFNSGLNVPGTDLFASEKIANALIVGVNVVMLPDGSLAAIVTTSDNKHTTVEPAFSPDSFSGKRSLWREFDPY